MAFVQLAFGRSFSCPNNGIMPCELVTGLIIVI